MPTQNHALSPIRTVTVAALLLLAVQLNGIISKYGTSDGWLIEDTGRPRPTEFIGVRAAGELALEHRAADAYDKAIHQARQNALAGRMTGLEYPWPYPPTYLLVAMILAMMPISVSALIWVVITLAGYLWVAIRISKRPVAGVWVAALPASLINVINAHTGFWTAGVLGYGLHALPFRPVFAGMAFGLLTMKPQFGLLIPIALAAGGHWRAIAAAAMTALALVAVTIAAFGMEPWVQFSYQMGRIANSVRAGEIALDSLVSIYGFLRFNGVADAIAMAAQATLSLFLALGIFRLWRSEAHANLKAAGLVSASLLATPYLFVYDLTALPIAIAFLIRHFGLSGLKPVELMLLAVSMVSIFTLGISPVPIGFVANVVTFAIVLRRLWPFLELSLTTPARQTNHATP